MELDLVPEAPTTGVPVLDHLIAEGRAIPPVVPEPVSIRSVWSNVRGGQPDAPS